MNPLHSLRAYTAHLYAKAAKELIPGVKLVEAVVDEIGFSYICECPQLVSPEMLPLLEERMRGWVKKPPVLRLQEMVPSNAASFFRDRKEPFLQERCLETDDELVEVVCLDHFADIASGSIKTYNSFFFKLFSFEITGTLVKVTGTAFLEQDELKNFVKKYKEASRKDWKETASLSKYLVFPKTGTPLFLPKGLKARDAFFKYFLSTLSGAQEVYTPPSFDGTVAESHALLYVSLPQSSLWERRDGKVWQHFFPEEGELDDLLKSSLLLFEKTAKILRFETQWTLGGIYPPKFENRKGVKERWKRGVSRLKDVLSEVGIEHVLNDETLSSEGPFFQIRLFDTLGRSIEGPKLTLNCVALEKRGLLDRPCFQGKTLIERELFPSLDSLVFKLIEAGSLKQVEVELEK